MIGNDTDTDGFLMYDILVLKRCHRIRCLSENEGYKSSCTE